ncbi:MAG: hypothetical protein ACI8RD_014454 [Bacillariaceae sp.]|jgi:hypothetical protein
MSQHELDVKINEAKILVKEQAKKHNQDDKYVEAKQHVKETVSGVKIGVEAAAAEEKNSDNNEEEETTTATQQKENKQKHKQRKKESISET